MTDTSDRDGGRGPRHRPPPRMGRPSRPGGRGGERGPKSARGAPREQAPPKPARDEAARLLPAEERIAKVIARAGIASRRDAEAMIEAGRVTLDGEPVLSPALNVGPEARIAVDGEPLPLRERTRLWLFHKPRGLVTTFRDPQGRPTVFEALPDEMPRVVAIGRLDMNTEGLLLLTNDGGLAKVIAQPETGWTRRYRVRAYGDVRQEQLDGLRRGVRVDEMDYGPIEAHLDRVQGDNAWLTLALKEGKNREVKRVLEHLGLQVNRLIRLSFGPFQLGDLEQGLVEEVRTKVLRDQLGKTLAEEAGVDFEGPVREPIAPFGSEPQRDRTPRDDARGPRRIAPRRAESSEGRGRMAAGRPAGRGSDKRARFDERPRRDAAVGSPVAWRQDGDETPTRRRPRRDDPKSDRAASAARDHERVGAITGRKGRRVLVERVAGAKADSGERDRSERDRSRDGDRPQFRKGSASANRSGAGGRGFGPADPREPGRPPRPFGKRPAGRPGAGGSGERPRGRPTGGKGFGGRDGAPRGGGPRGPRTPR